MSKPKEKLERLQQRLDCLNARFASSSMLSFEDERREASALRWAITLLTNLISKKDKRDA
jgi:hypothetical protein